MGPEAFAGDDDYPTYIAPCADQVVATAGSLGIIIGGSGQGEAIVANRVSGIRSIVYYGHNLDVVRIGRQHNDANMLSLGARCMDIAEAKNATLLFLTTDFSHEERHERRIKAIDA
jgi:ribose 5-phosphate isomerase B